MAGPYFSWPLIGRNSAHIHHAMFNTGNLISSLLVSQGQMGASNMWPLQTITRGHDGSEPLPSTKGRGVKQARLLQRAVVVKNQQIYFPINCFLLFLSFQSEFSY